MGSEPVDAFALPPLTSPVFTERLAFLSESQYWSRERLEAFQLSQLRRLVHYVERYVPFYKKVLREQGLTWKDFRKIANY